MAAWRQTREEKTGTMYLARVSGVLLAALLIVTSAFAAGPSYRLKVDGLACPFCAYGIEKKLSTVPGVAGVQTSIKQGSVIVTMRDGVTLSQRAAQRAVSAAGFTLRGFSRR
jgi:copper chaperone CopZ